MGYVNTWMGDRFSALQVCLMARANRLKSLSALLKLYDMYMSLISVSGLNF